MLESIKIFKLPYWNNPGQNKTWSYKILKGTVAIKMTEDEAPLATTTLFTKGEVDKDYPYSYTTSSWLTKEVGQVFCHTCMY